MFLMGCSITNLIRYSDKENPDLQTFFERKARYYHLFSIIKPYESEYKGKNYILKAPMFLIKNLPKGIPDDYSAGVFVAPNLLVPINCNSCYKKDLKPYLELIPSGTKIKVTKSFNRYHGAIWTPWSFSDTPYVIIEDEYKNISEMTEIEFRLDVLNANEKQFDHANYPMMTQVSVLKEKSFLEYVTCESFHPHTLLIKELVMLEAFSSLDLLNDIEITKAGYNTKRGFYHSCAKLKIKSLQALYAYYLYFKGSDELFDPEDFESDKISHLGKVQLEAIDYQKFKNFSESEKDKYINEVRARRLPLFGQGAL
jgi:hypothetical protein